MTWKSETLDTEVIFSNTRAAFMSTKRQRARKRKKKKKEQGGLGVMMGRLWARPGNVSFFFFHSQHEVANASFRYATESKSALQGWWFFSFFGGGVGREGE